MVYQTEQLCPHIKVLVLIPLSLTSVVWTCLITVWPYIYSPTVSLRLSNLWQWTNIGSIKVHQTRIFGLMKCVSFQSRSLLSDVIFQSFRNMPPALRPSMLLALLTIESTRMSSISLTPLSAHSQSSRPTISLLCMLLTLFQNPPFLIWHCLSAPVFYHRTRQHIHLYNCKMQWRRRPAQSPSSVAVVPNIISSTRPGISIMFSAPNSMAISNRSIRQHLQPALRPVSGILSAHPLRNGRFGLFLEEGGWELNTNIYTNSYVYKSQVWRVVRRYRIRNLIACGETS